MKDSGQYLYSELDGDNLKADDRLFQWTRGSLEQLLGGYMKIHQSRYGSSFYAHPTSIVLHQLILGSRDLSTRTLAVIQIEPVSRSSQ